MSPGALLPTNPDDGSGKPDNGNDIVVTPTIDDGVTIAPPKNNNDDSR